MRSVLEPQNLQNFQSSHLFFFKLSPGEDDLMFFKKVLKESTDSQDSDYLDVPLEVRKRLGSVGYNPNISHL